MGELSAHLLLERIWAHQPKATRQQPGGTARQALREQLKARLLRVLQGEAKSHVYCCSQG